MTDATLPTNAPEPGPGPRGPEPSGTSVRPLTALDRLLRGAYTSADALAGGRVGIPVRALVPLCVALGGLYGASMGLFSLLEASHGFGWLQVVGSALKVPLLFLLSLVVTFPSLYVVSAMARSRLAPADTLRLLLASVAVHLALLASLAPVAAFFTLSTDSYAFVRLMHVAFFAVSGVAALSIVWRALEIVLGDAKPIETTPVRGEGEDVKPAPVGEDIRESALRDMRVRRVFRVWIAIYGCVGAQMGWILRPFIGAPHLEYAWFRERESHFLAAVLSALGELFAGGG